MSSGLQGGGFGSQIKPKAETTSGVYDAPGEIHIVGHAVKSKPHVALEPRNSRMRVLPLLNFHVHELSHCPQRVGKSHSKLGRSGLSDTHQFLPIATLATHSGLLHAEVHGDYSSTFSIINK